jgi:hypothetical protein
LLLWAGFWTWAGWTSFGAMTTLGAAVMVGWYSWETLRIRRIADDQLEAQIAPMLMLKSGRAAEHEKHLCVGRLDRAWGKTAMDLHISNEGNGPALDVDLSVQSNEDSTDTAYELSAIPPGKFITVSVARHDFLGDEKKAGADRTFQVKFRIEYHSLARTQYRSRFRAHGWSEEAEPLDQSSLEYERSDRAAKERGKRLAEIARRGSRACHLCGDEIPSDRPLTLIVLSRRIARIAGRLRDRDRAPKWNIGLRESLKITTCVYCANTVKSLKGAGGSTAAMDPTRTVRSTRGGAGAAS